MKNALAAIAFAGALLSSAAFAADNAVVVTPGTGVIMRSKDIGAGVQSMMQIIGDTSGTPVYGTAGAANANVFTVQGVASMTPLLATVTGTVSATQSGTWNVNNIAGTISLPTGAATSALQTTINTTLGSPFQAGGSIGNTSFGISGTLPAFAATPTFNFGTLNGAATATLQGTGNTSLASIDTKTPALGQALAAASVPVVLTAAQLTTLTPLSSIAVTNTGTFAVQATQSGSWTSTVTQATGSNLHMVCDSGCSGSGGTSSTVGAAYPTIATAVGMSQGGNMVALTGTSGSLNVNITGGAGSGGTSSNFGSAFPAAGTALGLTNGTNMVAWSATTNYGTAPAAIAVPAVNASVTNTVTVSGTVTANAGTNLNTSLLALEGGGNLATIATNTGKIPSQGQALAAASVPVVLTALQLSALTPLTTIAATQSGSWSLAANQSVNVAQINGVTPLMGNGVTGTGSQRVTIASDNTAFSVNATLQASAATAIGKVDPNTIGTWGIQISTQNSATPTNGGLVLGQFNTSPTTITTGNVSPLQMDNAGNLLVNIKAGAASGAVAQGSTTSGQTGGLIQGAATTSAPTYTTATTNPLSMDTAGNLRVTGSVSISGGGVGVSLNTTPSLANGNGMVPTQGGAVLSATNGSFTNLLQGNAVIASGNPLFAQITAGSAIIGNIRIDQTTPGTTNGVQVNAALPAGTNLMGKVGIDQTTPGTTNGVQDAATSATGSAVSSKAIYAGAVSSGNLTGIIQADVSGPINISTATTTQLLALSAGKKIYVTAVDVIAGGTGNITFEYGTGTACAVGTTVLTGAYPLTAQSGLTKGNGLGPVWVIPSGNAFCALTSAGVQMSGSWAATQF